MQKEYICECGQIFDAPQRFNGHKSHCVVHLKYTGKLDQRLKLDSDRATLLSKRAKDKAIKKQRELEVNWIAENHRCERCNKQIMKKIGSGRYCSRSCANANRNRDYSNYMISDKLKRNSERKHEQALNQYLLNPATCIICNAALAYSRRTRKTCSKECYRVLLSRKLSEAAAKNGGNNNKHGARGTAKFGTYKHIHCDSSYELAFVVYCFDHHIVIDRNTIGFKYTFNNKQHTYYPDFLVNDTYIEIKNYCSDRVVAKIQSLPETIKFKILYLKDIQHCIDYCIEAYGKDYTQLYDRNYPSWLDKLDKE